MKRFLELDILRTLAIIGMVVYHTAYDVQIFYGWDIDVFSGAWRLMQITTASLFLLLVGITSSFSSRHPFRRFLWIGSAALLVSIVTYVIDPETYVRFGVLHLIALSALILPLFKKARSWLCIPGILLIAMGPLMHTPINTALLLPLGFTYPGFSTVDYFPLIPWFGVILVGYVLGDFFYNELRATSFVLREKIIGTRSSQLSVLAAPGRHSLMLYLIHQPIIVGVLYVIMGEPRW